VRADGLPLAAGADEEGADVEASLGSVLTTGSFLGSSDIFDVAAFSYLNYSSEEET